MRRLPIAILLASIGACGLHPQHAYHGEPQPLDTLGLAIGTYTKQGFWQEWVRIVEIDGIAWGDRKGPPPPALLQPGHHRLTVRLRAAIEEPLDILPFYARPRSPEEYAREHESRRILDLTIEPGHTYALHHEGDPIHYYVDRQPGVSRSPTPPKERPDSAVECPPTADRPDGRVLRCALESDPPADPPA